MLVRLWSYRAFTDVASTQCESQQRLSRRAVSECLFLRGHFHSLLEDKCLPKQWRPNKKERLRCQSREGTSKRALSQRCNLSKTFCCDRSGGTWSLVFP